MFKEVIIKEITKGIFRSITQSIKNTEIKSYSKERDVIEALQQHLTFVKNWSSEIDFSDLKKAKDTKKVFVSLELYFQPLRVRITDDETIEKFELKNIFDLNSKHIALLGQVGSGKTTSLKYFCQSLLFNEGFFESKVCYPIIIKLNEFNSLSRENDYSRSILINRLLEIIGIKFDYKNLSEKEIEVFKESILLNFLNENNLLVLIDGFDEMVFSNRRAVVINEFEKLASSVDKSKIILTSRTSDFKFSIPNINTYEICPLTDEQILNFAHKWLEIEGEAIDFLNKIKESPFYDTAIRPLTIAHLCALYERNKNIPEKPKTVYKKIVMLLLEDWNQQRNVHRTSKYSKFESDRKFEFLSSLAYNLTLNNSSNSFSKNDLERVYEKIYNDFDLEEREMLNVVSELESHSGIILQSGFLKYQFAHKSIQEYLTAEYIVKLPSIPSSRQSLLKLPNEMAIAVAISSMPSNYFEEFINSRFRTMNLPGTFIKPFINRLLLEKVDFNNNQSVGIAALYLYSSYISAEKTEYEQLKLFYYDDLILEFENFIKKIFLRNPKSIITNNYKIKSEVPSATPYAILLLERKSQNKKLPYRLFCRKSFIE